MRYNIVILPGDGIGPEIIAQAKKVLHTVGQKFGHEFILQEHLIGGSAYDACGEPLPLEVITACQNSSAVLLGSVGGPQWDNIEVCKRPERALLGLRSTLGLYTNLRPIILYPQMAAASPLKGEILKSGIDIMIIRELTGGIYFGPREQKEDSAYDTEMYTVAEIKRIAERAFAIAKNRKKRFTLVDKANILASSRLWRKVVCELAKEFSDISVDYLYVDNAAMQLIINPAQFDVILTNNIFGDILSDEASVLTGSIGMLPSASLGAGNFGMYEPIHGSAPDLAGKDVANPLAAILSVAMLLRYSLSLEKEAQAVERAVRLVLDAGLRTADIYNPADNAIKVGTKEMGQAVCDNINTL
ncbi:MAG: 3-isopropylmalate dehydrogenase [Bacillota bacterium]|jgi:3-isopropylmalate dehydrogenase